MLLLILIYIAKGKAAGMPRAEVFSKWSIW
jgi:hypothetical protein